MEKRENEMADLKMKSKKNMEMTWVKITARKLDVKRNGKNMKKNLKKKSLGINGIVNCQLIDI